jgi:hypothetical protein
VSKSRARLAPSLLAHHGPFDWGVGRCSRQPCQKQPSKKTATRRPGNATSIVRLRICGTGYCTRNRLP